MIDGLLEMRNLCGVPVLGKHSIAMYGVNYHNVVEIHFWELDTKEDTRIAVFMREWVGESPRGVGKTRLQTWCPYSITDMQEFLFLDRVEGLDPIFLHSSELDTLADSWKKCITDANSWNRKHKVFTSFPTRVDACGSDFLLMRQPLAKLLWEKLYNWGNATLPDMCVRSNGKMTSLTYSDSVWKRLRSKLDVEAVLATNIDRVAKAKEWIANDAIPNMDCPPDFCSQSISTKWVDKNGRDELQYEKYKATISAIDGFIAANPKAQHEDIMKAVDDLIANNLKPQNYALDA